MAKLDRSFHTSYNFKTQKNEIEYYKNLSLDKVYEIFLYLNSVAFNYPLHSPPKMDKTVFSCR